MSVIVVIALMVLMTDIHKRRSKYTLVMMKYFFSRDDGQSEDHDRITQKPHCTIDKLQTQEYYLLFDHWTMGINIMMISIIIYVTLCI